MTDYVRQWVQEQIYSGESTIELSLTTHAEPGGGYSIRIDVDVDGEYSHNYHGLEADEFFNLLVRELKKTNNHKR